MHVAEGPSMLYRLQEEGGGSEIDCGKFIASHVSQKRRDMGHLIFVKVR
jgi:hypothetical protein